MSKLAFLFPGQGAQAVGMAKDLCTQLPAARELFDRAQSVLGYDLFSLCAFGPDDKLTATDVSQPAIFVASLAALEKLRGESADVINRCTHTAGLSLGEYTALTFAGAFTFEEGLRLVQKRGEAMQAAAQTTPSSMASILLIEVPQVEEICKQASSKGLVKIANLLCPGNTVISGDIAAVDEAVKLAEATSAKVVRLSVAGAFHTDLMKPADQQLAAALAEVDIKKPRIPVWSNVDAKPHDDPAEIRDLLVKQVLSPVRWEETMRAMLAVGVGTYYEIGPGRVLAGLMKRIQRKTEFISVPA
ncbi:MAG: ACP S-malonyltransferase [Planctomycetia bacterium]|nr:ACP S-malonyltransferase [Planctomycetia bacterium]